MVFWLLEIVVTLVLAAVATMVEDLRWLLWVAVLVGIYPFWQIAKYLGRADEGRAEIFIFMFVPFISVIYGVYIILEPRLPIIEVGYDLKGIGLPIPLEPFSTTPIITIRQSRKVEFSNVVNPTSKQLPWPNEDPITPPEWIGEITLSNQSKDGLFNVSYVITFYVDSKKKPGGVTQLELPLHNLLPGQPKSFNIVNQSSFQAQFRLSKTAMAQIQGKEKRQRVAVRGRNITFFDRFAMVLPSFHKWDGDKMLEPNLWNAPKVSN